MEFLRENKIYVIIIYTAVWLIMSCLCLWLYRLDKNRAKKHEYRIREATLLTYPWLFGSIGGMLGMYVLRHKTKHWYFVLNNWCAFIVHSVLLVGIIFILYR